MRSTVFVINPNSTEAVTAGIDAAMAPLRMAGGPDIRCLTLAEGPPGIQTQRDVESVIPPLARLAQSLEEEAGAFVIACFSDPGLHLVREAVRRPVLGISECGVLTALTLGHTFGVIAILQGSIPRHLRTWGAMGVLDRFVGEMAIDIPVTELIDAERTLARMIEVGRRLRDERQAQVIVMGCAGMAAYRAPLQRALGIPVVEPSQAAAVMALGRVRLDWEMVAGSAT
ncbi:Asp/Glu/hydantoin racemase [Variovorax sp. CF079]|uniref:aspartate/glutamate racemase family protein n=1 Tax=Variovorax sp. CF079 TaxID=1882774 RepID=UPI0008913F74|nr:aspartate/glutamate racemase family protein [Variovorax sp. CF079]SDC51757.1 Asp/Glu/hydantoin racemase [Variovorax sp. CF079]